MLRKHQQNMIFKQEIFHQREHLFPVPLIHFWNFPIQKILQGVRKLLWKSPKDIWTLDKIVWWGNQNKFGQTILIWASPDSCCFSLLSSLSSFLRDVWKLLDVGEHEKFSLGHDIWSLEASLEVLIVKVWSHYFQLLQLNIFLLVVMMKNKVHQLSYV